MDKNKPFKQHYIYLISMLLIVGQFMKYRLNVKDDSYNSHKNCQGSAFCESSSHLKTTTDGEKPKTWQKLRFETAKDIQL